VDPQKRHPVCIYEAQKGTSHPKDIDDFWDFKRLETSTQNQKRPDA
jgi:hypothetical protein